MLELIYSSAWKLRALRKCWLYDALEGYVRSRAAMGYARETLGNDVYAVVRYATFLQRRGHDRLAMLPDGIGQYVRQFKKPSMEAQVRWALLRFIKYLRSTGCLPRGVSGTPGPQFLRHISAYGDYLGQERGLVDQTILSWKAYALRFMQYIHRGGTWKLSMLRPPVIAEFIKDRANDSSRYTLAQVCTALRSFLRYLYESRRVKVDFSAVVVGPRVYQHERAPRFLKAEEVQAILKAVDRTGGSGWRDYALLLLLATYGLRGIEVARLRFEDIDWRGQILRIRGRKAGNHSSYPLASAVAKALVGYLKHGRPRSAQRQVFLCHVAPFRPVSTWTIRHVVKKHLRKAGLAAAGLGAHAFRYACAQRLFEHDFSIKVIGDFLGHRHPESTQRYLKIDLPHLLEVAINDGEAML